MNILDYLANKYLNIVNTQTVNCTDVQRSRCLRGLKCCSYSRQPPSQTQWHTADKGDRKRGKEGETKREERRERDLVTEIVPGSNALIRHYSARKWPKSSRFPSDTHTHTHTHTHTGLVEHCLNVFALNELNLFISFHLNNLTSAVRLSYLNRPLDRPRSLWLEKGNSLKNLKFIHLLREMEKKRTD